MVLALAWLGHALFSAIIGFTYLPIVHLRECYGFSRLALGTGEIPLPFALVSTLLRSWDIHVLSLRRSPLLFAQVSSASYYVLSSASIARYIVISLFRWFVISLRKKKTFQRTFSKNVLLLDTAWCSFIVVLFTPSTPFCFC